MISYCSLILVFICFEFCRHKDKHSARFERFSEYIESKLILYEKVKRLKMAKRKSTVISGLFVLFIGLEKYFEEKWIVSSFSLYSLVVTLCDATPHLL